MKIHAQRALIGNQWKENTVVTVEQGKIVSIENGTTGDLSVSYLTPGLFDKHQHGGMGFDCSSPDLEKCKEWLNLLAQHGVTNVAYTLSSSPAEVNCKAIAFAAEIMRMQENGELGGAKVVGVHMEGPFLNPVRKGAMNEKCIIPPTSDSFAAMVGAHRDIVRAITIAPEMLGALELAKELSAEGIHVQAGHTAADEPCMVQAKEAGFSGLTHTFNAMTPIGHRAPGPVVFGIVTPGITMEAICDFVHLAPSVVKMLFQAKGAQGIAMISDSVTTAGLPDGDYFGGNHYVRVENGRNFTRSGGIAGGYHQLDTGVHNVVHLGILFEDAICSASAVPAAAYGMGDRYGRIAIDAEACLAAWDDDINCLGGFVHGAFYPAK